MYIHKAGGKTQHNNTLSATTHGHIRNSKQAHDLGNMFFITWKACAFIT